MKTTGLILLSAFVFTAFLSPASPAQTKMVFNVRDYGAKGNGKTLDSPAINSAIEAAAENGGGMVYFPAGDYLSGSIRLRSNITLYLDNACTIIAVSANPELNYDQAEKSINDTYQDYGHSHWHNGLIWGDSLHDISILGQGKIYGKGLLKDWVKDSKSADKTISLYRCRNVLLRDFTMYHGGWFAILATGVDNFTLDNLKIDTNRDGVDIDCCKNVHVSNLSVNSPYDDGLCLKSTFALGYARSTENVTITNCALSGYDEGSLLDGTYKRSNNPAYGYHPIGRIKFGTESNGGFKNITISNCVFDYCRGLALETVDGGLLEDVAITNITMRDIVNDPIFLRLGARMRGPKGTPIGALRRVTMSNITVYNADRSYSCTIAGLPGHPIEAILLSNIRIYYKGGGTKEAAAREIPENENAYPEPGMFGTAPAYGLFVRHAKDLEMTDVTFGFMNEEHRPALFFDDVSGISIRNLTAQKPDGGSTIVAKDISDFTIIQSKGIEDQKIEAAKQKNF